MSTVLPNNPLFAPHLLVNRLSQPGSDSVNSPSMSSRKRKASEEPFDNDRMSTSPSASPSMSGRPFPSAGQRTTKRTRTSTAVGKPLSLPRLLETLSADELRQLLQNVCDQHPELQQEIVTRAPRPSIESTLSILSRYENAFRAAFPLGNRSTSDYAYNRVRQHLRDFIEALREFTPHFLPPHESQDGLSLSYLDTVTDMIHRLPEWDTFQYRRHKNDAYDEISRAWALVIREATKRAGGFHLQFGGWDRKLIEHDEKSGGRLLEAVNELKSTLGFMHGTPGPANTGSPAVSDERLNIRQQLFAGTYGQQLGVGQGGW